MRSKLSFLAACLVFLFTFFANTNKSAAMGSAGSEAAFESRYIVDMPTAGVLPKSSFAVSAVAFDRGGLSAGIHAAPFSNFNMGISFSGVNFIGTGDIEWQEIPAIHLRFRPFDETLYIPAFTMGISTQGSGAYITDEDRFEVFSPGAYLAVSKNFRWIAGTFSLHGGINYSFEPPAESRAPNLYMGVEHSIGPGGAITFEYNANIDDGNPEVVDAKGMLNASLRWSVADGLTLGLQLRDMLGRHKNSTGFTRFVTLEYISPF
jgi:hypothetical protein